METINTKIPSQRLSGDLQLNGAAEGTIVVPDGVFFRLNGAIAGDLVVEEGGTAEVNGAVTGSVWNKGGAVVIRGMVMGAAHGHTSGQTTIEAGAMVNGQRH